MNQLFESYFSFETHHPEAAALAVAWMKSSAIVFLALGLVMLLRRRSAAARSWCWRGAFVTLAALALWHFRPLAMQQWGLAVRVAAALTNDTGSRGTTDDVQAQRGTLAPSQTSVVPKTPGADPVAVRAIEKANLERPFIPDSRLTRLRVQAERSLIWLWLGGFGALVVLQMLRATAARAWLRRNAQAAPAALQAAVKSAASAMGLRKEPRCQWLHQSHTPLITGLIRPTIWLPPAATDWSAAKLRGALCHELAHHRRHDLAWQGLAVLTASFWWWNPLTWLALRRLRAEAEHAADDAVVLHQVEAPDYARSLVEIAAAGRSAEACAVGVAMIGAAAIERRVRALLRSNPWRGRIGRLAGLGLCALAACQLTTVLVSCHRGPPEYISEAKLVAGGRMVQSNQSGPGYQEYLTDFYGTITETLESSEMRRRALDRVRALHPDLKETPVNIQVAQNKGSAIFNVRAFGADPKFTRLFLDSLLEEFLAFRAQIREQQRNKALTALVEDVVKREKSTQTRQDELTKFDAQNPLARHADASAQATAEFTRLRTELARLREELDELQTALSNVPQAMMQKELIANDDVRRELLTRRPGAASPDSAAPAVGSGLSLAEMDYLLNRRELEALEFEQKYLGQDAESATAATAPQAVELRERLRKAKAFAEFYSAKIKAEWQAQLENLSRRVEMMHSRLAAAESDMIEMGEKAAKRRQLEDDHQTSKRAYEELFTVVHNFQVSEEMTGDHITVMERASSAVENPN